MATMRAFFSYVLYMSAVNLLIFYVCEKYRSSDATTMDVALFMPLVITWEILGFITYHIDAEVFSETNVNFIKEKCAGGDSGYDIRDMAQMITEIDYPQTTEAEPLSSF
uniref:Uncharacterized protein n=1 Tax=Panagrolaimus sp. JU765 TaxID=591449 RepID=A0AC34PYJ6_9BILA